MGTGWGNRAEEAPAPNIRGESDLPKETSEKFQAGSEQTRRARVSQRTRIRQLINKQHLKQCSQQAFSNNQSFALRMKPNNCLGRTSSAGGHRDPTEEWNLRPLHPYSRHKGEERGKVAPPHKEITKLFLYIHNQAGPVLARGKEEARFLTHIHRRCGLTFNTLCPRTKHSQPPVQWDVIRESVLHNSRGNPGPLSISISLVLFISVTQHLRSLKLRKPNSREKNTIPQKFVKQKRTLKNFQFVPSERPASKLHLLSNNRLLSHTHTKRQIRK